MLSLFTNWRYERLPTTDVAVNDPETRLQLSTRGVVLILLPLLIVSTCVMAILHPFSAAETYEKTGPSLPSCGRSPTSARRAACLFDVMLFTWVPKHYLPLVPITDRVQDSVPAAGLWASMPFPKHAEDFFSLSMVSEGTQGGLFVRPEFLAAHCQAVDAFRSVLEKTNFSESCDSALAEAEVFCVENGDTYAHAAAGTDAGWALLPVQYVNCV
ncbi:hypothetical protein F5Y19DRAFT_174362 [Xylariaceae sp. FL1651]|nr:hypothetical protein F5Y19DRAFT_174362 [Xylariaceae sp. FL1651]